MKKLRVRCSPNLEQDLDAITTEGTMVYDAELTKELIKDYGSIENFKKSDKFKQMNM